MEATLLLQLMGHSYLICILPACHVVTRGFCIVPLRHVVIFPKCCEVSNEVVNLMELESIGLSIINITVYFL